MKSSLKAAKEVSLQIYAKPKAKDAEFFAIIQRNATLMGDGQLKILEVLLTWRDYVARVEDESVRFVMPNDVMFDIAKSCPKTFTELDIILKRHPKHTHHEHIYKYETDLLKRINEIIVQHSKLIEQRVAAKSIKTQKVESESSSSSSSDSEQEEKKIAIPSKPIALAPTTFKVEISPILVQSKVFPNLTAGYSQSFQSEVKQKSNKEINIYSLMGLKTTVPKPALSNPELNPAATATEMVVDDPSELNIVEKIELVTMPAQPQSDSKMEEVDPTTLPASMSSTYNMKRGRKNKNKQQNATKQQKLSEGGEESIGSLMTTVNKLAQQSRDNYTNEQDATQKQSINHKRRAKKQQIKDNLNGFDQYQELPEHEKAKNPEAWKNKLDAAEAVIGRRIDRLIDQKGSYKKRGQAGAKNKNVEQDDKQDNRFDFLKNDSDSD